MRSADFENLNSLAPGLDLVKEFREKGYIRKGSPLWWSTDYQPDPREYLPFDTFRKRLVHFGDCDTLLPRIGAYHSGEKWKRDVYLYPEPTVPMTVMELTVNGQQLPLMITARPYHPKEIWFQPVATFIEDHPLKTLPEYVSNKGAIDLPSHFYPHIRGLFAGRRGNHLFWYSLNEGLPELSWDKIWKDFGQPLHNALEDEGLGFMEVNSPDNMNATDTQTWKELQGKKVTHHRPVWWNDIYTEVSATEFLEYEKDIRDLILHYPLRLPQFINTLRLIIVTRTNQGNKIKKPAVLGIYADNGACGYCRHAGILRICDRELASSISQAITTDFQIPVDTVLFTPRKGSPKYERVPATF